MGGGALLVKGEDFLKRIVVGRLWKWLRLFEGAGIARSAVGF